MTQNFPDDLNRLDRAILAQICTDGRITNQALGDAIGLSGTAAARRQKTLEDEGYIEGYQAKLNMKRLGFGVTVFVKISLESQSEDALFAFEQAILDCPSIVHCSLMSGRDDYLIVLRAQSLEDFERIHKTELSRLPRVSHMESSFALRQVVDRPAPPALFERKGGR